MEQLLIFIFILYFIIIPCGYYWAITIMSNNNAQLGNTIDEVIRKQNERKKRKGKGA